jgi:hypothetical protein
MKIKVNYYAMLVKSIALLSCIALVMFFFQSEAMNTGTNIATIEVLFTQTETGDINVQVNAPGEKKVQLYLFTASGEFVKKLETATKTVCALKGIGRGQYLYQCFEKDLQLKSGKLLVSENNLKYD